MAEGYKVLKPGDPTVRHHREEGLFIACCDCGLVHHVIYEIDDEHIIRRAWRDNRLTGAHRRLIAGGRKVLPGGKWELRRVRKKK